MILDTTRYILCQIIDVLEMAILATREALRPNCKVSVAHAIVHSTPGDLAKAIRAVCGNPVYVPCMNGHCLTHCRKVCQCADGDGNDDDEDELDLSPVVFDAAKKSEAPASKVWS